jgi:hypothetical protein
MTVIISWVFALFSGRFIFRRLYGKDKGHSVVRYYTAGAFCISYIFTFALYVFPALLFDPRSGGGPDKGFEDNLMRSLAIFVGMALFFTAFGFGFGKLKEKFADDSQSN